MRIRFYILAALIMCSFSGYGQPDSTWAKWDWLMGKWKGAGMGAPGEGKGTFSFKLNLDNNILERSSHTEYPATADKPASTHDDLLIVYKDFSGNPLKAIYFDNEGHSIRYDIKLRDHIIIFTSEWVTGMPVYRLTYTLLDDGMLNTKFEISKDGKEFSTYVEGKSKKVK